MWHAFFLTRETERQRDHSKLKVLARWVMGFRRGRIFGNKMYHSFGDRDPLLMASIVDRGLS